MKVIFCPCCTQKDYITFCHNLFTIFPDDGGNRELATILLTDFVDCMRDDLNHHAATSQHHQKAYGEWVQMSLQVAVASRSSQMPLPWRQLLFV
jgi:hypothetical protein